MRTTPHGLLPADVAYIHGVLATAPAVERAWLYGSRARGTHQPGADVDLALEGSEIEMDLIARLKARLQDEGPLPYFFDLTDLTHLPPRHPLRQEIARDGRLLWERPSPR